MDTQRLKYEQTFRQALALAATLDVQLRQLLLVSPAACEFCADRWITAQEHTRPGRSSVSHIVLLEYALRHGSIGSTRRLVTECLLAHKEETAGRCEEALARSVAKLRVLLGAQYISGLDFFDDVNRGEHGNPLHRLAVSLSYLAGGLGPDVDRRPLPSIGVSHCGSQNGAPGRSLSSHR